MPRSRRPQAYGDEYEQLLLRAFTSTSKGDFTLQLESPNAAASLRSKIYAYFTALRSSSTRADLVEMADKLSVRTAGSALVLFRAEDSWDARALRSALGLEKGFNEVGQAAGVVAPANPHLERLKSLRSSKKP